MSRFLYTEEMDNWIRENYPKYYNIAESHALFNKAFNLNVSIKGYKSRANKELHLKTAKFYTDEQEEWFKENYPKYPVKETLRMFNEKFGREDVDERSFVGHCNKALNIFVEKRKMFSDEEEEFLKSYYSNHTSFETADEFEKRFGRKVSPNSVIGFCNKQGIIRCNHWFRKEEEEWLLKNWSSFVLLKDAHQAFCKEFGKTHSAKALCTKATELGVKLDKTYWTKEEEEWLKENYQKGEYELKELFEIYLSKFNTNRSYSGFISKATKLGLGQVGRGQIQPGDPNRFTLKKRELGIPENMVLSNLGNGEYIALDKRTYKDLGRIGGCLGKGEITKVMVDIIHVQQKIKDLKKGVKM